MKKLYLFDSFALIYRAYFAFQKNPLMNSKGQNVSAITGFLNTIWEIKTKYNPTHYAIVFDAPAQTDRQAEHDFYKANRQETRTLILHRIVTVTTRNLGDSDDALACQR